MMRSYQETTFCTAVINALFLTTDMWVLLLLLVPCLAINKTQTQKCFEDAFPKYIKCNPVQGHGHGRPNACDCTNKDPCYLNMHITKTPIPPTADSPNNFDYLVNGTFQGPTIIAEEKGIVVVDVFNDMTDEDTSIHFHGMHQHNVPWIDGVGNLTQYPIPAKGKFRYIFRAFPQGTHWYHSHMRYQRDSGLFGVLIVRESQSDVEERLALGAYVDEPSKYTLTLLERFENLKAGAKKPDPFCLPDGSSVPKQFDRISFFMNGKKIAKDVRGGRGNESHSEFLVVSGKNYRFRVLGATKSTILIVSIDFHKLHVIATDGYLVHPFETDFLIVHVGERYDFILKAKKDVPAGSRFPLNIQTLAVDCNDNTKVAGISYAFVVYTDNIEVRPAHEKFEVQDGRCANQSKPCKILNCPFKLMPTDFTSEGTYMNCYSVLSLRLLYPTPARGIPSSETENEYFFNFKFTWGALINGIKYVLPDIPQVENPGNKYECEYPVTCAPNEQKTCTHAVYLNNFDKTARFTLSAILQGSQDAVDLTHPVHMHGHTYFIAKIGYPVYYPNGTIKAPNPDLTVPRDCGPARWTNALPKGISVNSTTVRKDVIIIPAGGYVVIHFIEDNPGYWFMHCHIDEHLNNGMAIAIGENHNCSSTPPKALFKETDEFCFTVDTFKEKEADNSNGPCSGINKPKPLKPSSGHTPVISTTASTTTWTTTSSGYIPFISITTLFLAFAVMAFFRLIRDEEI